MSETDPSTNPYAESADSSQSQSQSSDSVFDALKGAGVASLTAWSRLGDLAGEFGRKFRADREADISSGTHAATGEDITDDYSGLSDQFKAALANARAAYQGAQDDRDFRAATASLAGDAESIFRDFAGSVTRAADIARESDEADKAKAAFQDALGEVRETFNTAVSSVRNRAESGEEAEDTIADMRTRLEDMMSRLSSAVDRNEQAGEKAAGAGSAAGESAAGETPDIIDGEVVDGDTENK